MAVAVEEVVVMISGVCHPSHNPTKAWARRESG